MADDDPYQLIRINPQLAEELDWILRVAACGMLGAEWEEVSTWGRIETLRRLRAAGVPREAVETWDGVSCFAHNIRNFPIFTDAALSEEEADRIGGEAEARRLDARSKRR